MRGSSTLAGYGLSPAALCACVGLRLLSASRETLAVPRAAVALDLGDSADVHLCLASQVALDCVSHGIDLVPDAGESVFVEVSHTLAGLDAHLASYLRGSVASDAVDCGQSDLNPEIVWDVYPCDNRQFATSA